MSEDESNSEEKEMSAKQNRIRRRAVQDEDEESSDDTILTNPMKALSVIKIYVTQSLEILTKKNLQRTRTGNQEKSIA